MVQGGGGEGVGDNTFQHNHLCTNNQENHAPLPLSEPCSLGFCQPWQRELRLRIADTWPDLSRIVRRSETPGCLLVAGADIEVCPGTPCT